MSVKNGKNQQVLHTAWQPGAYIRLMAVREKKVTFLMSVHVDQYFGYAGQL
jgi:hypothetical protein